jgi:GT2 family glycosyltransferase
MISFIVVTHHSAATIADCLQHLLDDEILDDESGEREIIVVDNASTDDTREIVRRFSQVKLIASPKNLGFGGGNQLGFENSSGEIVIFLNPDTTIAKGFSQTLRSFFAKRDDIGILGGRILNTEGTLPRTCNAFPTFFSLLYQHSAYKYLFPRSRAYRRFMLSDWDGQTAREVDSVSGACFAMSRAVLQKIGGFDDTFFLYFEEFDLAQRVRKLGLKIYFEPELAVQHIGQVSTTQMDPAKKQAIYNASCNYYLQKYHGTLKARLFWMVVGFFNFPKRVVSLFEKAKHD